MSSFEKEKRNEQKFNNFQFEKKKIVKKKDHF